MKILIVDDNEDDRRVLRQTIEAHHYEAIVARDGEEGLQKVIVHRPALIISDVLMPGMDGFHFLRSIKELGSIPFIFYSAVYGGNEDVQLARSLGADAFLIKPKDPVELWEEIESHIHCERPKQTGVPELVEEDAEYLKKYSHVVATKLEEKVREQDATLAELEKTLAERLRVEKALRESETRYRQLLGSVTDYIYTVHFRDGFATSTVHGPGCAAVTGYTTDDYVADPHLWLRMVHREDLDRVTEQAARILAGEPVSPLEHRIIHRDGRIRWVRNTPVPHYDPQGNLIACDGLISDITERRLAEEEYSTILRTAMDGFLLVDMHGGILDVNDSYCLMTGFSRDEVLQSSISELDAVDTDEDMKRRILHIMDQGSARFETKHRHKSGCLIDFDVRIKYLPDKGGRMVSFFRDITEERKLERELFQAKRLEIIGQLAGGVAHEVRNPLNAILSISEALFREKELAGNPELEPYIGHIRAQINRLSKLMNDLLDLGKPIKPSSISQISLQKLCADTLELWKTTEAARGYEVVLAECDPEDGFPVLADDARLQQVLLNLLDNAAQNSPRESRITMRIEKTDAGRVVVRITDGGKGIAPDRMEKVFEPFYTTRRDGTGLGLTLVKHFIENMGGETRMLNNDPPPGCTAEIYLVSADGEERHETENTPR